MSIDSLFPQDYESSRNRFRLQYDRIRTYWPDAQLEAHRLSTDEDLTIDWVHAPSTRTNQSVVLFTTGEHGIEGYVGSAMLHLFLDKYLEQLNPANTGLILVHAINPWGMKHKRRTNAHNVDLNRNFLLDTQLIDKTFNAEYDQIARFLNPAKAIRNLELTTIDFALKLFNVLLRFGQSKLKRTTLLGQYRYPKGIFYGGEYIQEETQVLMKLYRLAFQRYDSVIHLDMHTGYGPRYQMSLVNSALDGRSSAELAKLFAYSLVVAATDEEFYAIRGDMIDFIYTLRNQEFPGKELYATSFEFGTYGDSPRAMIRLLRTMILENQMYWHGTKGQRIRDYITHEFIELFYPQAQDWQAKAAADAQQAIEGILSAYGILSKSGS